MAKSELNKVLFVTFDVVPDPTGSSSRSTALLEGLASSFEVDALTVKTPNHAHIERYHGARLLRVPVGSGDVRSRAEAFDRAVRRQLQSEEYDLVHFTDPFGGFALCEMRPTAGYRLVYDARGFPSMELRYVEPHLEGDRKFLTKLRRQEIFCLMNADLVLASCATAREHILSLGVPADKVQVAPPPVDLARFAAADPPEGDPCRLVYVGSHASWQGLPSLLFALRKVAERAKFSARIVGPSHGSWKQQLEDMIREFDLKSMVSVEGPVPHEDIPGILAAADVGLAPLMKVERNLVQGAAPMKIAEYMAAGRPVVSSDLPVTRDLVTHDVTGLLHPATDEEALADCIVRLCEDSALRRRLGEEGRRRAESRFDAAAFQRRILGFYREMVAPSIIVSDEAFEPAGSQGAGFDDPTVTLPVGARPEEEPPTSMVSQDEITQTSIGMDEREPDTDPRVRASRRAGEDTGSIGVGELPWVAAEDRPPVTDSGPAISPEDAATGEVPVHAFTDDDKVHEAETGAVDLPVPAADEATPAGERYPPPADADEGGDAQRAAPPGARPGTDPAATPRAPHAPGRAAGPEPRPHTDPVASDARPPTDPAAPEQRPPTDPAIPPAWSAAGPESGSAEPPAAEPPAAEPPAAEPPAAAAPTPSARTPAPTTGPAVTGGSGADDDDLVEIDPDDAILLEEDEEIDEPLGLSPLPPRPDTDPATGRTQSGRDPRVEGEPTDENQLPSPPIVRGVVVDDASPAPEYGGASPRRKRDAEEDTSPGV